MRLRFTAREVDADRKVYSVLRRDLALSSTLIKRLKAGGGIFVDGEGVFTDRRVRPGETVEADLALSERQPDFLPEKGELDILFENDVLIAVNKPSGMLVHPSRSKYTGTLAGIVSGYLLEKTGCPACHVVNRLDRDTSGVVLYSKYSHFKTLTIDALHSPEARKEYRAFLFGKLLPDAGTIDMPIARVAPGGMERWVTPDGQRAVTHYETLRCGTVRGYQVSEVRFLLETGRTHQIRVHCAASGAPIVGDTLYGTETSDLFSKSVGVNAQLLHAEKLTFREPLSGELVDITAPVMREDMLALSALMHGGEG